MNLYRRAFPIYPNTYVSSPAVRFRRDPATGAPIPVPYDYNDEDEEEEEEEDDDDDEDEDEKEAEMKYKYDRTANVYKSQPDYKRRTPYEMSTNAANWPPNYGCTDENAFMRWLSSRPHWKLPRTRPADWVSPWCTPPVVKRATSSSKRRRQEPRVIPPPPPATHPLKDQRMGSVPIIPTPRGTPYVCTPAALPIAPAATPYVYTPAVLPVAPTATPYAFVPYLPVAVSTVPTPVMAYPPLSQMTPQGYIPIIPQTKTAGVAAKTPAATPHRLTPALAPVPAKSKPATPAATVNYGLPPPVEEPIIPPPPVLATPGVHYQWVAHPFPHPTIPVQQFFPYVPVVPAAWTPGQLNYVSGGLPFPGTAPNWCGDSYKPPPGAVAISPWLAPNPRNATVPHVLWDAAIESPAYTRRVTVRGLVVEFGGTPQFENALAVTPGQKKLVVSVSPTFDALWGPLTVKAANAAVGVKVGEVFWALHKYLQTQVSQGDLERICASEGGKATYKRMEYACWRRCRDAQAIPDAMAGEGMKRVDLIKESTVFWGMWGRRDVRGKIYLCVGFCPSWM